MSRIHVEFCKHGSIESSAKNEDSEEQESTDSLVTETDDDTKS